MKVSLIDYTGIGHPDPLYAARLLVYSKNTRLQSSAAKAEWFEAPEEKIMEELGYVANTLRSSWEFVEYVFQIEGVTRAFTHQLVRTRHGSYAQQAQRVVDMSGFTNEMPQTVRDNPMAKVIWDDTMAVINQAYQDLRHHNIPAQDARGVLPTNVHTNIIAKFNLRTLADLLAKRKNLRAQGEYADVAREMEKRVLEVHPWVAPFINPDRLSTPKLDALLARELGNASPIDKPTVNEILKEVDKIKATWG